MKPTSKKKTMMTFKNNQWCDFARGIVDDESRSAMEEALTRSTRARDTVDRFRRVARVAERDAANEIPAGIISSTA